MDAQRTEGWFAARAGRLTGSRFADLMARTKTGPSASRAALLATLAVERLTGQCVETYSNAAMQRGTELEPEARGAYEAHAGVMVREVAFVVHSALDFVGVSPDGYVGDSGLVEIKCPANMGKHLDALRNGSHAAEYRWQVQGQLWVCEREWCDVVSYDPRYPDALQLAVKRVERDEDAIKQLADECAKANDEIETILADLQKIAA